MISKWLLAGSLAFVACTPPRQIVLSIDTTAGVPCDIDRIRVVASSSGAAKPATFEQSLKEGQLPITVTLLDETPAGSFELQISGLQGDVEVMHAKGSMQFRDHKETEAVLLGSDCMTAGGCDLSAAMSASETSSGSPRGVCRYATSPALESFEDACNAPGSTKLDISHSTGPIALDLDGVLPGSGFRFYGRPIEKIWVSRDGYLSFTKDSPDPAGTLQPGPLDRSLDGMGAPPPPQSAMVFWDTLNFLDAAGKAVGQVCYVLQGDGNNRQFRLTWEHACVTVPCTPPDDLNFTLLLEESSQRVAFTYGDMTAGNSDRALGINATVGLVHDAIGCPADECQLATGLCEDGVTPCGYSQVFTDTVQKPKIPGMQPKVPDMQFVTSANP